MNTTRGSGAAPPCFAQSLRGPDAPNPAVVGAPSRRLTFDESTAAISRIAYLQSQLLDYTGHVTRGMTRDDRRALLDEIQRLRELVGAKPLDMTGRWRRARR